MSFIILSVSSSLIDFFFFSIIYKSIKHSDFKIHSFIHSIFWSSLARRRFRDRYQAYHLSTRSWFNPGGDVRWFSNDLLLSQFHKINHHLISRMLMNAIYKFSNHSFSSSIKQQPPPTTTTNHQQQPTTTEQEQIRHVPSSSPSFYTFSDHPLIFIVYNSLSQTYPIKVHLH